MDQSHASVFIQAQKFLNFRPTNYPSFLQQCGEFPLDKTASIGLDRRMGSQIAYWVSIPLGAFLLFQIQPMIGKALLPKFGGSSSVWIFCLLFFQICLLVGYSYAYVLSRYLKLSQQFICHGLVLAITVISLRYQYTLDSGSLNSNNPQVTLGYLLFCNIGLPYIVLSTTSPLLQSWFSRTWPEVTPYKLFALSNAASLFGLLSFPFLIEPRFGLSDQSFFWACLFLLYSLAVIGSAWTTLGTADVLPRKPAGNMIKESAHQKCLWLAFSAIGVSLLMGISNHLTTDIAPIPFLWILPLAVYLVTFILCFESERWYDRRVIIPTALICMFVFSEGSCISPTVPIPLSIGTSIFTLLACAMVAHGELARLKPPADELAQYYLYISLGGALGGIGVGVLAPYIFNSLLEIPITFVLLFACTIAVCKPASTAPQQPQRYWQYARLLCLGFALSLAIREWGSGQDIIARTRNFYGVVKIRHLERQDAKYNQVRMYHGAIIHGAQFTDTRLSRIPTEYYGPRSAVGDFIRSHPLRGHLKVGILGLGAGTIATYGQPGDTYAFYEINPAVEAYAREYFSFLRSSPAETKVILGDARVSLESQPLQNFDVLILDVFSGDAIPMHLLTEEAFELYVKHLKPNGSLLAHITNQHLNLGPIFRDFSDRFGFTYDFVSSPEEYLIGSAAADWVVLRRAPGIVPQAQTPVWTDDFSNLLSVVDW